MTVLLLIICHITWSTAAHELTLWQPKVNWSRSEPRVGGSGRSEEWGVCCGVSYRCVPGVREYIANIADTQGETPLRSERDNMHEEFCNSANLIWAWRNNLLEINSCAPNQHNKRIRSWIKWGKENLIQFWNGCQNSKLEFHHINGYQRLNGMKVKSTKIAG